MDDITKEIEKQERPQLLMRPLRIVKKVVIFVYVSTENAGATIGRPLNIFSEFLGNSHYFTGIVTFRAASGRPYRITRIFSAF